MDKPTILLADSNDRFREDLRRVLLDDGGFEVVGFGSGSDALTELRHHRVDLLITELHLRDVTGLDLIDYVRRSAPGSSIMVITDRNEVETAVELMKSGVGDYVKKPASVEDVAFRAKRLLMERRLLGSLGLASEATCHLCHSSELLGTSAAIAEVRFRIGRLATSNTNVLITGERGVGKEVAARALHAASAEPPHAFVSVNCSKTGAQIGELNSYESDDATWEDIQRRPLSALQAFASGTLFLDEVADLSPDCQKDLLGAFERLAARNGSRGQFGSSGMRVISSSARDLLGAVEQGEFCETLLRWLAPATIEIPPLRDRVQDISILAEDLLRKHKERVHSGCTGFSAEALVAMKQSAWPGNVRELSSAIERAVLLAGDGEIKPEHLFSAIGAQRGSVDSTMDLREATKAFERDHILCVLGRVDGNKIEAAQLLGIGLSSLYRKLDGLRETGSERGAHGNGQRTASGC